MASEALRGEMLAEGFRRLSPESRYRRFFTAMPELTQRQLNYLARVDHHDHEALVTVDPVTLECVGVARFVRTAPGVAEPAIVVADDWQGRGVGSRLMGALVERAREEGIRRFEAPVLASNHEAIRVLERLGSTTRRPAGHEVELLIDLPQERPMPDWRAPLKHFAAGRSSQRARCSAGPGRVGPGAPERPGGGRSAWAS